MKTFVDFSFTDCTSFLLAQQAEVEVAQALERLEPDPQRRYFIEASADYDTLHTIWLHNAWRE